MRRFEARRRQWCETCDAETDHEVLILIDEGRELIECAACIVREARADEASE